MSRYNQIIRIVNSSQVAVYRSVYIKCETFARLDYVIKSVLIWKKYIFNEAIVLNVCLSFILLLNTPPFIEMATDVRAQWI